MKYKITLIIKREYDIHEEYYTSDTKKDAINFVLHKLKTANKDLFVQQEEGLLKQIQLLTEQINKSYLSNIMINYEQIGYPANGIAIIAQDKDEEYLIAIEPIKTTKLRNHKGITKHSTEEYEGLVVQYDYKYNTVFTRKCDLSSHIINILKR